MKKAFKRLAYRVSWAEEKQQQQQQRRQREYNRSPSVLKVSRLANEFVCVLINRAIVVQLRTDLTEAEVAKYKSI